MGIAQHPLALIAGAIWPLGDGQSVASTGADDELTVLRGTGLEIVNRDGITTASIQNFGTGAVLQLFDNEGNPRTFMSVSDDLANVAVRGAPDGKQDWRFVAMTVTDEQGPKFRVYRADEDAKEIEDIEDIWVAP